MKLFRFATACFAVAGLCLVVGCSGDTPAETPETPPAETPAEGETDATSAADVDTGGTDVETMVATTKVANYSVKGMN